MSKAAHDIVVANLPSVNILSGQVNKVFFGNAGIDWSGKGQPPQRADADLCPVVALPQAAFPLGASDDAKPPHTAFERVKQVLSVHFAAAWDFLHRNVGAPAMPLTG